MVIVPLIVKAVVTAAISAAISWLFAPSVKGPRLKDLNATGQGYGAAIPRVYGTVSVPASIIWASDLIEKKKKKGGKGGGGSVTTYSYSQHVALAVCEGPAYPLRIWAGGQLIWDVSNPTPAKKKSKKQVIPYNNVVCYNGTEVQTASSLIQSYMGAANTPAYRGLCYITLQNLQLEKFGNRLPPFQVEVTTASQIELVENLNLPAPTYCGSSDAVAYTLGGFSADDVVVLDIIDGFTYDGWSPWSSDGDPLAGGTPWTRFFTVKAGATQTNYHESYYITAAEALAADMARVPIYLTGETSYKIWMYDGAPSDNRGGLSMRVSKIAGGFVTLQDVVSAELEHAGLDASEYDVSDLSGNVDGYVVPRPMSARDAIEPLRAGYWFDVAESEGKVKCVMRGGDVVATIPEDDLAASNGDQPDAEPFFISRMDEEALPQRVDVHYLRKGGEYEVAVQHDKIANTDSTLLHSMELALVLDDTKARDIASVTLYTTRLERTGYQWKTGRKYAHLEPMDLVTVTYGSDSYRIRITEKDEGGGLVSFKGLPDDQSLYVDMGATRTTSGFYTASSSGTVGGVPTSGSGSPATVPDINDIAPTSAVFLDIPPLSPSHTGLGLLLAVGPDRTLITDEWEGAVNYYSLDGGATFIEGSALAAECTIGVAGGTLGNFTGGATVDCFNTLSVTMVGELESTTWDGLIAGQNALLVGSEIIQFQTATLTASTSLTNTYRLSKLLRGRRGTEAYIGTHAASEIVVLLDTQLTRLVSPETRFGTTVYRVGTIGEEVDDLTDQTVNNTGVCLKPWAPVNLRAKKSAAASWDINLTWNRRDRLHGDTMLWAASVPMSESVESYDIEIYDTGFTTLKRTVSANSSASYAYTNAMQVTDFGSTQSAIGVKVYQISAIVGRGFAASEALTVY